MAEATTSPRRRRGKGDGALFRTKDGRVRGFITATDPDTGRSVRHYVSARTQADAREKLSALRRELETSGRPSSGMTLADYLATWLEGEATRLRPATLRSRQQHVATHIVPRIGGLSLRELQVADVDRMTRAIMAGGLSGRTAAHVRSTLRRALRDAERYGYVPRNVASLSTPPRVERTEVRVLTAEQTRAIIDGTTDDPFGPLFTVAATTGLRRGEVLGLAWSDLADLEGRVPALTVRRTLARDASGGYSLSEPKTAKSRRTLELGPTTVRALRRQRARQAEAQLAAGELWQNADSLVFTDELGRSLSPEHVTWQFGETLKRLGLPHVRLHDLRHGAASLMLAQGIPLKVVSDALGHSTITITADTYAHLDREQRREASSAIERAIGGKA